MLPLTNRLKLPVSWNRNPDYQFRTTLFKLIAKYTENSDQPKVGFIVTTKVGKATERNRLKRKLSEYLKIRLPQLKNGVELVLILYPLAKSASNEDLSLNLDRALSKISVAAGR